MGDARTAVPGLTARATRPATLPPIRSRSPRRAVRLLALALGVVAMLAALALPARTNEDDVGFLARQLQSLLSDRGRDVQIRGFEGALSSRATIREMVISDAEGPWLIMRDAALDWDRAALFARRVEVNQLTAARIEILRPPVADSDGIDLPSPTARAAFSLPELPVAIRIGTVRADRVVLGAPVLGEPAELVLDGSARLEGGAGTARLEARRVDGRDGAFRLGGTFSNVTRQLTLDISLSEGAGGIAAGLLGIPDRPALSLTLQGDDPIARFRAEIALATDGQDRVDGQVTFVDTSPDAGLLDGAVFRLDLGGDLRPLLVAELHDFFGPDSRLAAEARRDEDGALSLREFRATTRALTVQGQADLAPNGAPRRIDLRLDLANPDAAGGVPEPVVLPGTDGAGRLTAAELVVAFDAATGPEWQVIGRLMRLDLPDLAIDEVLLDARGQIGLTEAGRDPDGPAAPIFDGIFEFAALGIDPADPALARALGPELYGLASLVAPGDGAPLLLQGFALEGGSVTLTGNGTLAGLQFDGFIEAEATDLAPFSDLAGRPLGGRALLQLGGQAHLLTGALDLTAQLDTTDLTVNLPEADNLLAGNAGIDLSIRRDTEGTELRRLAVQAGTLGLSAQGRLVPGGTSTFAARLRLSDLRRLGNGYGGALALAVDLRDRDGRRQLDLTGDIADLALSDQPGAAQIAGLFRGQTRLSGRVTETGGRVRIEDLSLRGDRIGLQVSGDLDAATQTLAVQLERLSLAALLPGAGGTLTGRADLAGPPGGRRLAAEIASDGAVRTGQPALDVLFLRGLTLGVDARELDGGFALDRARLTGAGLDLRASGAQGADGALSLAVDGSLAEIGRLATGLEGTARLEGRLNRPAGAQAVDTRVTLTGPSQLSLTAQGRIEPDLRLALALDGTADAALANPFIAPATVQGPIAVSGRIAGPPGLAALQLRLDARQGRFVLPPAGLAFTDITASGELNGLRLAFSLDGASTRGGRVRAAGTLGLSGPRPVDLTATADRFGIVQPGLFEGTVSGNVRLAGPLASGPTASGRIVIDAVEIRIPNSPLGRSGYVPQGIQHVGEPAAARTTRERAGLVVQGGPSDAAPARRAPIFLDLTLEAPGRVYVRGRGLDAELGGRLQLAGSTADTIPSGAFNLIRGRMDLLGNRFTLTEGSASLMGSFMPLLRLVASTDSGGVITSVVLEGPANAPEIRFESVPELPQDEVLARLVFGRSLTALSPFQAAQLGMSIATLTGRTESSFLDRTRQALGLDDLDLTTEADGTTAVRAGRYIGERVYADVGVNSQGQSEVRLELDLSSSLTLRGRADSAGRSRVGIFFERDY